MSRKPKVRRVSRHDEEHDEAGNGLIARVVDRTFENPAMSGGLLVMALTATAILSNALFLQSSRHPDPLFVQEATPTEETIAAPGKDQTSLAIANPPMPRLAPRVATPEPPIEMATAPELVSTTVPDVRASLPPAESASRLVTDIQRELARIGLYRGTIDGVSGPRTEAAIREFETAAGIVITGIPTPELLIALRQPLPPRETQSIAAVNADAAELNRREQERARLIADDRRRQEEIRLREAYAVVQTALNRIGYGPLPIDGAPGTVTEDAIRRFELDNGMPITGKAGDALIARLFAIGAIKPG